MKSGAWPDRDVIRMDLGSSEADPIRILGHEYQSFRATQYDMHYPVELGVVLAGRMRRSYQGRTMEVGPGGIWLNGIWEPHGFQMLKAPCRVVAITVLPQLLAGMRLPEAPEFNWLAPFTAPLDKRPMPNPASAKLIMGLAKKLAAQADGDSPASKIRRRIYLMELLLAIGADWKCQDAGPVDGANPYDRLSRAVELVVNSQKLITVQVAAKASGMSRNIFSRKFQQLMGSRFSDFCLRHRLGGAATQLRNSHDAMAAIAQDWDFTDVSHLHHRFKAHFGCSPGEYRKRGGSTMKHMKGMKRGIAIKKRKKSSESSTLGGDCNIR